MKSSLIKKSLVLFSIISVLIYLSFSFIVWEFNPYFWGVEQRESFTSFIMICFLFSPIVIKFSNIK